MAAHRLTKASPKTRKRRIVLVEREWRDLTDDEKQAIVGRFGGGSLSFTRFDPALFQAFRLPASKEYLASCRKKFRKEQDLFVLPSTQNIEAWVDLTRPAVEDGFIHLLIRKGRELEKVTPVGIIPYVP